MIKATILLKRINWNPYRECYPAVHPVTGVQTKLKYNLFWRGFVEEILLTMNAMIDRRPMAEGVRFELTVNLRPRRFSRPLP
jgi:hypothetical protein